MTLFGSSGLMDEDTYHEIRNMTGIEIDDRKQRMVKCVGSLDSELCIYIDFFKALPDFNAINIEDRVSLTKGMSINSINAWLHMCLSLGFSHKQDKYQLN